MNAAAKDLSLNPPLINTHPGPEYFARARKWQGIPSIERAPNGRLWAIWYTGGEGEGPENHVVLVTSADDGQTWSEPKVVIAPPGRVRAYDPNVWHDPLGRLWVFWAQSLDWFDGRCGVWAIMTENSTVENPLWNPTRRLANGIMMNKPTVLSNGNWLLPAAVWDSRQPKLPELATERRSNVIASTDQGETWVLRGGAEIPDRTFDEHSIVELNDGALWLLARARYGVGESFSIDQGASWSPGQPSAISGPNSRFFIRRLRSGRLLLVNHFQFVGRSHLTARLSEDDGASWFGGLLLDERNNVAYPDGVEATDGRIFVIYDHERYMEKEILLAIFREEDVIQQKCDCEYCRLRGLVNRAGT
jgi:hypothetical protein